MPIIYPVNDEADESYGDFAAELSDAWIVGVEAVVDGEPQDTISFGPFAPSEAFRLATEVHAQRPSWGVTIQPLTKAVSPAELIESLE